MTEQIIIPIRHAIPQRANAAKGEYDASNPARIMNMKYIPLY